MSSAAASSDGKVPFCAAYGAQVQTRGATQLEEEVPAGQATPVGEETAAAGAADDVASTLINIEGEAQDMNALSDQMFSELGLTAVVKSKDAAELEKTLDTELGSLLNAGTLDQGPKPSPPGAKEEAYKAAAVSPSFDMRGSVGQSWSATKASNPDLSRSYEAVGKSYSAQRAFRQRWAKEQYETIKKEREMTEVQYFSIGQVGKYKPFSCMVRDEGGDDAAVTAAMNIVKTEILLMREHKYLLGRLPWFKMNWMSKRIEFAHLETTFSDMYEQCWKQTTVQAPPVVAGAAAKPDAPSPSPTADTPEIANTKRKRAEADKTDKTDKTPTKGTKRVTEEQKELQKLQTKLKAVRQKLVNSLSDGHGLLTIIDKNPDWERFKNPFSISQLTKDLVTNVSEVRK